LREIDEPMIIGLSGQKGSGKDTVAAYLVKEHGFERKAFADPLKQSIAALFDIPFSAIDKFKNIEDLRIVMEDKHSPSVHYTDMSFRTFLQRFGTEAHRDIFGKDFWLDYTLPVQGFYPGRAIVVTDCRFSNEANRIRELGGLIVRITRSAAFDEQDQHRSEVMDFDWDYMIENDGNLSDLYMNVEDMLCHMIDRVEAR